MKNHSSNDNSVFAKEVIKRLLKPPEEQARPHQPSKRYPSAEVRRHANILSVLLQALTLQGRALAKEEADAATHAVGDPETETEARLADGLLVAHQLLMSHPLAMRALFAALTAEGRRYAHTERGAALRAGMTRSPTVHRGALLWSCLTTGLLDDSEPSQLPSSLVDLLAESLAQEDLESLLTTMKERAQR